jgi:WD40 repeat protein
VAAVSAFEPGVGQPNGVYRWRVDSALAGRGPKLHRGLLPEEELITPHPVDVSPQDSSRTLAFSRDGSVLAGGLWRGQVPLWEFPSGQALPPLSVTPRRVKRSRHHPDPAPPPWRLAFSADGRTLAVADESVTLYEVSTGTPRAALPAGPAVSYALGHPPGPYVHDLAFHPSEPLLATACGDEVLRWWDGRTGSARQTFDCGVGPLTAVAFSPDGCVCAAAGDKGRVALVDVDR